MTDSSSPRPRRARGSEFAGWSLAVLFAMLALIAVIPVITHPLPPISDYINHLARMYVIAKNGSDANLARFYGIEWQIIPNLMMDLIVPWLARVMNIYTAGQVFTIGTFLLMMTGVMALNRALFGRWSLLPVVAFPLFYNFVYLTGLMNYLFGIGVALWALAGWVMLRERHWLPRYLLSALCVIALFFCHLSAAGVYGLGLLSYESWRLFRDRRQWRSRLPGFVAAGLPFLVAVPLLLKSPTWQLRDDFGWEPRGKIDGLIFAIEAYSDVIAFGIVALVAVAAVWAVRHKFLRMHPFGWFMAVGSALIYLAMPRTMFATYMADQRLPIAFLLILIASVELEIRHRIVRRGFIALLLLITVLRVIEVDVTWTNLSAETLAFKDSVRRITRGSTVLIATANATGGDDVRDLGLVHAACLAMIERSAMVTRAFTVRGKQVMHVQPAYADRVDAEDGSPPTIEQLVLAVDRAGTQEDGYWAEWQKKFDYVYVLFTDEESENPLPELLTLAYEGERFRLYRVNKQPS